MTLFAARSAAASLVLIVGVVAAACGDGHIGDNCPGGGCDDGDGGTPGDGGSLDCPSVSVALEPTIPTVMLLIDRSSSMNEAIGDADPTVRWTAVRNALVDPNNGLVKRVENQVSFGAILYSAVRSGSPPPFSEAPCPRVLGTPATQLGNFVAVRDLLLANEPAGGTPTEASVRHALASFPAAPDSPKVLLLATDGNPDNCDVGDTTDAIKSGVEDAVRDAHTAGITTYVLSVGSGVAASHLQRIANEGVGQDRLTGTATVYLATTTAALEQAFDDIIRGVRSCQLDLDGNLDPARAGEGTVLLDGSMLAYETDWIVVDSNTIELIGSACDAFLTESSVSVTAEFPCGVFVE